MLEFKREIFSPLKCHRLFEYNQFDHYNFDTHPLQSNHCCQSLHQKYPEKKLMKVSKVTFEILE